MVVVVLHNTISVCYLIIYRYLCFLDVDMGWWTTENVSQFTFFCVFLCISYSDNYLKFVRLVWAFPLCLCRHLDISFRSFIRLSLLPGKILFSSPILTKSCVPP